MKTLLFLADLILWLGVALMVLALLGIIALPPLN
jgi:hypothetical protein